MQNPVKHSATMFLPSFVQNLKFAHLELLSDSLVPIAPNCRSSSNIQSRCRRSLSKESICSSTSPTVFSFEYFFLVIENGSR